MGLSQFTRDSPVKGGIGRLPVIFNGQSAPFKRVQNIA
jgi:hypothetical protein